MTKVVKNDCYGGFGLSREALELLAELKGVTTCSISGRSIPRDDPHLVKVVEKLGQGASDSLAELVVVEIPGDVEWYMDEYDGWETIREKHRQW